jgi:hypothetical protein
VDNKTHSKALQMTDSEHTDYAFLGALRVALKNNFFFGIDA